MSITSSNVDRARLAYETFRGGFHDGFACPLQPWEEAPIWVREVVFVAYLQGTLDGHDSERRVFASSLSLDTLKEARDCIEDLGSGKGGWAWEEVIDRIERAISTVTSEPRA